MVGRLADDHARARRLAEAVADTVAPGYDPGRCRTNIVVFEHPRVDELVERLAASDVLIGTVGPSLARLVTHADVDDDKLDAAIAVLRTL
jgi:threonine aldolase